MFKEVNEEIENDHFKSYAKLKMKYNGKTLEEFKLLKIRAESREKQFASLPLMVGVSLVLVTSSFSEILKRSMDQWLQSHDTTGFMHLIFREVLIIAAGIVIMYTVMGFFIYHLSNKKLMLESIISELEKQEKKKKENIEHREQRLQKKYK